MTDEVMSHYYKGSLPINIMLPMLQYDEYAMEATDKRQLVDFIVNGGIRKESNAHRSM